MENFQIKPNIKSNILLLKLLNLEMDKLHPNFHYQVKSTQAKSNY